MDINQTLYLAIQITDDHAETLEIHPDDDIEDNIDHFCYRNELDDEQQQAIYETVLTHLENNSNNNIDQSAVHEEKYHKHGKKSDNYTKNMYISETFIQEPSTKLESNFGLKNENYTPNLEDKQNNDLYNNKLDRRPSIRSNRNPMQLINQKNRFYERLKQESDKQFTSSTYGQEQQCVENYSSRCFEDNFQPPPELLKYSSKKFPPVKHNETDENIRKQLSEINQKLNQENAELEKHFDLNVNQHVKASDPGHNDQDLENLNNNLEERLMGNVT